MLSICDGVIPSRAAVSRSMMTFCLQPADLLIAVHVLQLGNLAQLSATAWAPTRTVRSGSRPTACTGYCALDWRPPICKSCTRLEVQGRAGNMRQFGTEPGDHLVGADLALAQRLEGDEHAALVLGGVAADEGQHVLDRRVLLNDADELGWFCLSWPGTRHPGRP